MRQNLLFSVDNFLDVKPLKNFCLLFDNLEHLHLTHAKQTGRKPIKREYLLNALVFKNLKSIPTLTELYRELVDNPSASFCCGFDIRKPIPSVERFSAFLRDTSNRELTHIKNQLYFTCQVRELTAKEIRSLPPRRRGQRIPTLIFSYQYHPALARKDAKYDGLYAIGTSLHQKTHSTDDVFSAFKEQHHIETAHHQWKAPIRLRPLFLKKITRIESLVFVQFLALMAFYLLQRLYRLAKGPASRTTGETLLKRFVFAPITVRYEQDTVSVMSFSLKPIQNEILEKLRFPLVDNQIRSYVTRPDEAAD